MICISGTHLTESDENINMPIGPKRKRRIDIIGHKFKKRDPLCRYAGMQVCRFNLERVYHQPFVIFPVYSPITLNIDTKYSYRIILS